MLNTSKINKTQSQEKPKLVKKDLSESKRKKKANGCWWHLPWRDFHACVKNACSLFFKMFVLVFTFILINCSWLRLWIETCVCESRMQADVFVNALCSFNATTIGRMAEFPAVTPVTPLFAFCCIPLFSFTCIPISSLELVSILGMNSPPNPPANPISHSPISFSLSVIFSFFSLTDSLFFHPLQFSLITKSFKVYSHLNWLSGKNKCENNPVSQL